MEDIVIEIPDGKLKGAVKTDLNGGQFYSFVGVPYAKPPVGSLRFKDPVPIEPWNDIKDATKEGDPCVQRDLFTQAVIGSEDCLHLNVYTKTLAKENRSALPVMVWIHGGAFVQGSNKAAIHGPEYLMAEDIVLVVINYRLGVFGFLSMEDSSLDVPGNAGLKDQNLALQWVQKNISALNGDPNNVTIFGISAGSASVHYHILSPLSRGLFHKAIMQSGSVLNPWTCGSRCALDIVKTLGKEAANEKEAFNIIKDTSTEELYAAQEKMLLVQKIRLFAPVIEKPGPRAFISKTPIDIITSGEYNKVPLIIGYVSAEGMLMEFMKAVERRAGIPVAEEPPNLEALIPPEMNLPKSCDTSKLICEKITNVYFNTEIIKDKYAVSTDSFFLAGIIAAVKHHVASSPHPVHLYKVTLDGELNLLKRAAKLDGAGTCHGDDQGYLFRNDFFNLDNVPDQTEKLRVSRFVKLWTNFAKFGNPTPNETDVGVVWKPVDQECMHFLDIGEHLIMDKDPESERMKLWSEIYRLSPFTEKYM